MKNYFSILLLFVGCVTKAQPGGGGGLKIYSIFDSNFNKISLRNSDVKVRAFVLGYCLYNEQTPISHEIELKKSDTITLYPASSLSLYYTLSTAINLRLYFLYKSDTCIVDFYNVHGGDESGNFDQLDSLVLKSGYTSYSRIIHKDSIIVTHKSNINISFLAENNLPQSYYCVKGRDALYKKDFASAINYLQIATETKNRYGKVEQHLLPEIHNNLAEAYYSIEEYNKAEEYSSKAIKQVTNNYEYYKTHIKSLIKLNKLNEALSIYDLAIKHLRFSQSGIETWIRDDRAFFNINYLHDYDTVIIEYQKLIETNENMKFYPNRSIYDHLPDNAKNYFVLGSAKYGKGYFKSAYDDWLKALELNYGDINHDESATHFENILKAHSDEPMPYLLNAIALYKKSNYSGGQELSVPILNTALNDLSNAEKLGIENFKINLWKAKILLALDKNTEALEQINLAISKNNKKPELYNLRYDLRSKLGMTKWGDDNDADIKKGSELSYKHQFEELNITSLDQNDFRRIQFRIYDTKTKVLYPNLSDKDVLKAANLSLLKGKTVENIELSNNIRLQSIDNTTEKINPEVILFNDSTYGMVFSFLYRQISSKTIEVKCGNEKMILVFSNLIDVGDIFIDSIAFEKGLKTINVQNIGIENNLIFKHIKKEDRNSYYKPSGMNIKVIRISDQGNNKIVSVNSFFEWTNPYLHVKNENNDTTYIYYGDDKRFLFSKGIYKTYKFTCPKPIPGQVKFDTYKKDCYRDNKFGTWYYYDINGAILLESNYVISSSDHSSHPSGRWKYYNNGTIIMEQIYKANGKIVTLYY